MMQSILLLVGLQVAAADTTATDTYYGRTTRSAKADEIVCKMRMQSGTRFRTKLCMTRANWDLGSERAKAEARELIDGHKAAITPPG